MVARATLSRRFPPHLRVSPAAVLKVRTLQDVQRDFEEENATFIRYRGKCEAALSAYDDAWTASRKDPDRKALSGEAADAKESKDACKAVMDDSKQLLADLKAERAQLQAPANVSTSEQKSMFLLCFVLYCTVLYMCFHDVSLSFSPCVVAYFFSSAPFHLFSFMQALTYSMCVNMWKA